MTTTTTLPDFLPEGKPVADRLAIEIRTAVQAAAGANMYTAATIDKLDETARRFTRYLQACGVACLQDVEPAHVAAFVKARPSHRSDVPASATQHLRRSNLRSLFRFARAVGLCTHDPTIDLPIDPRRSPATRPLTDTEVHMCRLASFQGVRTGRHAAVWALAETTAVTAEIAAITTTNVDLTAGTVALAGSRRTLPRTGHLTPWGVTVLTAWITQTAPQPTDRIVYRHGRGSPQGPAVAIAQTLYHIYERANLAGDETVRTGSIAAWVGVTVFAATGDIVQVARTLGLRSLDIAARRIGWDWQATDLPRGAQ